MALTGLLLLVFLIEHLYGNLKLLEDPTGRSFDAYVEHLQSYGFLLVGAEIVLALLFLCHIFLGLRLTMENMQARNQGYVVRSSKGGSTIGSLSMAFTGCILLAYLVKHLLDFRLRSGFLESPAGIVNETLGQATNATVYLLASAAIGLHLSHGATSALQTLGVNHVKWNSLLRIAGLGVAFLLALGFAAIPLVLLLRSGGAR
jgi:succinate dehydrogenase / fumarate reductase cytochrome b subunit